MKKDYDHDLIDRMNNAFSEEIQESLEKVLSVKLKPILQMLEQQKKEQKKQGSAIKRLQKTLDVAIKMFDGEDMRLRKRIERVEEHLGLQRVD